jgi:hypothetical protein
MEPSHFFDGRSTIRFGMEHLVCVRHPYVWIKRVVRDISRVEALFARLSPTVGMTKRVTSRETEHLGQVEQRKEERHQNCDDDGYGKSLSVLHAEQVQDENPVCFSWNAILALQNQLLPGILHCSWQ